MSLRDLCNLVFPSAGFPGRHCAHTEASVTPSNSLCQAGARTWLSPVCPSKDPRVTSELRPRPVLLTPSLPPPASPPGLVRWSGAPHPAPHRHHQACKHVWLAQGHTELRREGNSCSMNVPTCQQLYSHHGPVVGLPRGDALWGNSSDVGGSTGAPGDRSARGYLGALGLGLWPSLHGSGDPLRFLVGDPPPRQAGGHEGVEHRRSSNMSAPLFLMDSFIHVSV